MRFSIISLFAWGASVAAAANSTGHHDCLPGEHCHDYDCCAQGSSCNTCPHGWEVNNYDCAWEGNRMCKGPPAPGPTPPPGPPAPSPGWCLPGEHCKALDCCAWGSSCYTCPNGYFQEDNQCAGKGDRMCNSEYPKAGPTCSQSGPNVPPAGACKQIHKYKGADWDACVMVDGRGDLPQVTPSKEYDVYFMRKTIEGENPQQHAMAEALGMFHSGILFQEKCTSTERETFFIEFYALNFDARLMIPINLHTAAVDHTLKWNNTGYVGWYKTFNATAWLELSPDAITFIGSDVSGTIVNALMDRVPAWYLANPNYNVWSDFQKSLGDPTQLFRDNQCHAFSQWVISTLSGLGADFSWNQAAICRNYVPLVGADNVREVDMNDPNVFKDVALFYESLGEKAELAIGGGKVVGDKGHALLEWMKGYKHFYLVNPAHTKYYYAPLADPYFAASEEYTMKPMHLQWQNPELFIYGKCRFRTPPADMRKASGTGSASSVVVV